jgi:hypothetical protein
MTTTQNAPAALSKLSPRLRSLSQSCWDLYERDLQRSRDDCFNSHSRRVWERLNQDEREEMRQGLERPTVMPELAERYIDITCSRLIGEFLQEDEKSTQNCQ